MRCGERPLPLGAIGEKEGYGEELEWVLLLLLLLMEEEPEEAPLLESHCGIGKLGILPG